MLDIIPISAFKDNYIWLLTNTKAAWVVDPGVAAPVITTLQQRKLDLAGILLTHHHADHSGGIAELVNYARKIPVISHQHSSIKHVTQRVKQGDNIICLGLVLNVMEIPGHTLDHLAFHGEGILFCGDTLFSAGCGKVFEGTYAQMHNSLTKLNQLTAETKIYCGHEYTLANLHFAQRVEPENGDINEKITRVKNIIDQSGCTLPATLAEERNINPFLRTHVPAVIQAAEQHVGKKLHESVEVFQALREWKNSV